MGALRSLLKWGFLGLLVLLIPWLLLPAAVYIGWRIGIFKGLKKAVNGLKRKLRFRDRLFKLTASCHKELRMMTAGCSYYLTCNDSPFALLPDFAGFRCVSALVIWDNSGIMDNYRNAIDEAMRFLLNSHSIVIITLDISDGIIGCRIQVSEPCFDSGEGWLQRLGSDIADRGWALENAIQSLSPSLRVKVCRGEEILHSPFMEGNWHGPT